MEEMSSNSILAYGCDTLPMLHEVLLALSGHCGGIFKDSCGKIQVIGDLPFVHPSELNILNKLAELCTHYMKFCKFVKKYGCTLSKVPTAVPGGDLHGLYLKSFCSGLDEVLDDYRATLVDLEREILADPHLPVSHILCELQQYELLFPGLAAVVEQVITHRAHGCYILDILYKGAACGMPNVRDAVLRILHVCHGVLFKQLSAWLLHGSLMDPYKEFFVQLMDVSTADSSSQDQDDDLGIMGVSGRQMQRAMSMSAADQSREQECFSLRADLLPVYIPTRVANKILFVGESIQMFEDKKKPTRQWSGNSILRTQEDEFAKELHGLSQQKTLNMMVFEEVINKIRACTAEHLWRLVVEESDLLSNLRIMKDFYLLGRGELYLAFIDQAQTLLQPPPTGTTEHDINMTYQQAARNVLIEDEGLLQKFHLTVKVKVADKRPPSSFSKADSLGGSPVESGWASLGLGYSVQWPLHIFFTPSVLEKYNRLFPFLLAVKRTQLALQQGWVLQMQHKTRRNSVEEVAKWQLRAHMSFLIDNLQYYLQVDVIESQFGILVDKINSTHDFEEIKVAHDLFLATLLAQSFVHMKPVFHCLHEILAVCSTFCHLLSSSDEFMSTRELSQLQSISKNFQRQSGLLFKILSNVRGHNVSSHLAKLQLRLDFNKYYSCSGGQLGNI